MFINNNISLRESKHINIKYLTIKKNVKEGEISIESISTVDMIADLLTKGLSPCVYERHVNSMGLAASWNAFV